jgi:uncharacterized RDD family membrane protein YckC
MSKAVDYSIMSRFSDWERHPPGNLESKAELNSRGLAFLIDLVVYIILVILINAVGNIPAHMGGLGMFAYYIVFEAIVGYTPGKGVLGLVVTKENGEKIGWKEAIIRNVLRVIDILPTAYIVGAISISGTNKSQRIGDIAAKTLVLDQLDSIESEDPVTT